MTLMFRFIVEWIERCVQYWICIIWIEDLLTIFHFFLNLHYTFVCCLSVLNDICQLLWGKLGGWAYTPLLRIFIAMLDTALTSKHWNKSICVEYNHVCSSNQNLHSYNYHSLAHYCPLPLLFHSDQNLLKSMYHDSSRTCQALTWLLGIAFAGLTMCSVISLPVPLLIATNIIFKLYPSFNLKAF